MSTLEVLPSCVCLKGYYIVGGSMASGSFGSVSLLLLILLIIYTC